MHEGSVTRTSSGINDVASKQENRLDCWQYGRLIAFSRLAPSPFTPTAWGHHADLRCGPSILVPPTCGITARSSFLEHPKTAMPLPLQESLRPHRCPAPACPGHHQPSVFSLKLSSSLGFSGLYCPPLSSTLRKMFSCD